MATLTIDDKTAREIYTDAAPELKKLLENSYSKDFFSQKITDRIKSFEDACRVLDRDPKDAYFSAARPHENALRKWEVVCEALNEGVVLNFANSSQQKWYVWLVYEGSGFRFGGVDYTNPCASAGLGSRHLLCSRALAEHAAKYFLDLLIEAVS
jgi:hypothetical protein